MTLGPWLRLLARHRFDIEPFRIGMAVGVTFCSLVSQAMAVLQSVLYGRKASRAEVRRDPVIILGLWRSGTTLLHELLALDGRHTFPDTLACFAPESFLLGGRSTRKKLLRPLLPPTRPMDNMPMDWDLPQEDEFAICALGLPSPYENAAFPRHAPVSCERLDPAGLGPGAAADWKRRYLRFLRFLALRDQRRLVLKSPGHMGRLPTLLDVFPEARFVLIVRDPLSVVPSAVNTWNRLCRFQGFQRTDPDLVRGRVIDMLAALTDRFERDRRLVPPGHLQEIRYEDLVARPAAVLEQVYAGLGLGGFEAVRPNVEQYFAQRKDYRRAVHSLSPELAEETCRRFAGFMRRYGYETAPARAAKRMDSGAGPVLE